MIEKAYREGEPQGLAVWCSDQAGPFQTVPYLGTQWQPEGQPRRQPHEYIRNGTAKLLTLFHPATGHLRAKGITSCTNQVLHPWLQQELSALLTQLPPPPSDLDPDQIRQAWQPWYEGLSSPPELPEQLPVLRAILVLDNLAGHKTATWVHWCFQQGIALLYTPLGASWLNMAESIQRIIQDRALRGHHPSSSEEIIAWLEAAARGWDQDPTPFVWGGKRAARRQRARQRQQALAGSGACVARIRRAPSILDRWRNSDIIGK